MVGESLTVAQGCSQIIQPYFFYDLTYFTAFYFFSFMARKLPTANTRCCKSVLSYVTCVLNKQPGSQVVL